jgi:hypothetical protein
MSTEEIDDLQQLLATYRRALAHQLRRRAAFDAGMVPTELALSIDHSRAEIARLKDALRAQGVVVEDVLGDVETPAEQAEAKGPPGGAQIANADIAGIVDARGADFSGARGVQISGVQVGDAARKQKSGDKH